jgi:hypothetical protein
MSKRLIWLLGILAVVGLVACGPTATPTLEPTPTAVPTAAPTATSKPTSTPRPASGSGGSSEGGASSEPGWQIPKVRESDWTHGASDAPLVIVEYSDFQ